MAGCQGRAIANPQETGARRSKRCAPTRRRLSSIFGLMGAAGAARPDNRKPSLPAALCPDKTRVAAEIEEFGAWAYCGRHDRPEHPPLTPSRALRPGIPHARQRHPGLYPRRLRSARRSTQCLQAAAQAPHRGRHRRRPTARRQCARTLCRAHRARVRPDRLRQRRRLRPDREGRPSAHRPGQGEPGAARRDRRDEGLEP